MNEFVAKKLAEVQAFANLESVILEKAGSAFRETAPRTTQLLEEQNQNLIDIITDDSLQEMFRAKTGKTTEKLTKMMDLYVGDEWDNPVEVLEWLSFYSGAAAAHAALVAAALGELNMLDEKGHLERIHDAFWRILETDKEELAATGIKRVSTA